MNNNKYINSKNQIFAKKSAMLSINIIASVFTLFLELFLLGCVFHTFLCHCLITHIGGVNLKQMCHSTNVIIDQEVRNKSFNVIK